MGEFHSIEEQVEEIFDINYEFDAPQYYDFNRIETEREAKDAELWLESTTSYPPSPFAIKFKWRNDSGGDEEFGIVSMDYNDREACNGCNEDDLLAKTNSQVKSSRFKNSTLMKPTASYLAKLKQSRAHHSSQLHRSLQNSSDRLDSKSSKSPHVTEVYASKRQKLEAGYLRKVAHLKHQALFVHKKPKTVQSVDGDSTHSKPKVTIPVEPKLQTERRAQTHRSKTDTESDKNTKSTVLYFKALPLNKKILEAPSFPLPKKNLPKPPEFQLFHLRTSQRARQHAFNNAMNLPNYVSTSRNENTGHIRSFNSVNAIEDKSEGVNDPKACPLNKKKLSSTVDNCILRDTKESTAIMEFKLPDEPPIELFNKLSLSSEVHSGENFGAKMAVPKEFKENEPGYFLLQCQIAKESSQRNGGMQYQCRSDKTNEIGQPLNFNMKLRLDII